MKKNTVIGFIPEAKPKAKAEAKPKAKAEAKPKAKNDSEESK